MYLNFGFFYGKKALKFSNTINKMEVCYGKNTGYLEGLYTY